MAEMVPHAPSYFPRRRVRILKRLNTDEQQLEAGSKATIGSKDQVRRVTDTPSGQAIEDDLWPIPYFADEEPTGSRHVTGSWKEHHHVRTPGLPFCESHLS